jgi:hypothetical protein
VRITRPIQGHRWRTSASSSQPVASGIRFVRRRLHGAHPRRGERLGGVGGRDRCTARLEGGGGAPREPGRRRRYRTTRPAGPCDRCPQHRHPSWKERRQEYNGEERRRKPFQNPVPTLEASSDGRNN